MPDYKKQGLQFSPGFILHFRGTLDNGNIDWNHIFQSIYNLKAMND